MSEIRVNNITNRDGSTGTTVAGIPVVDSNSHFVVPTGRTGQRYVDGGENIVRDGLVLHLDAKYSYPSKTGITSTTDSLDPDVYTWYDMSGNGNDGELTSNNKTASAGPTYSLSNGGIFLFDGSQDFISVSANTEEEDPFREDFSIECWYYPISNTGGYKIIFETQGYRDSTGGLAIYSNNDRFRIWRHNPTSGPGGTGWTSTYTEIFSSAIGTFGLNSWKHFVFVRTGSVYKLYVDTESILDYPDLKDSAIYHSDVASGKGEPYPYNYGNPKNLYNIGGGRTEYFGTTKIAKVAIYNKALTAAEVLQNYNALKGRFGL